MLNTDESVHAIMVHLPLPDGVDTERVQSLIDVNKDVEGVNPANIGNIVYGRRSLVPCTALAVMEMIESTGIQLPGRRCVCVGASNIVGKPVAVLLKRAEATVISTNVHTVDQGELTRTADVLVAAAGVPHLITADIVKPGAVVIDVGVNRIKDADGTSRTVGDVAFDEVGLPGFQFLQARVGGTGGHTNLDFFDTIPLDHLMKNAVIVATFVYHAAMSDERVPRKGRGGEPTAGRR